MSTLPNARPKTKGQPSPTKKIGVSATPPTSEARPLGAPRQPKVQSLKAEKDTKETT